MLIIRTLIRGLYTFVRYVAPTFQAERHAIIPPNKRIVFSTVGSPLSKSLINILKQYNSPDQVGIVALNTYSEIMAKQYHVSSISIDHLTSQDIIICLGMGIHTTQIKQEKFKTIFIHSDMAYFTPNNNEYTDDFGLMSSKIRAFASKCESFYKCGALQTSRDPSIIGTSCSGSLGWECVTDVPWWYRFLSYCWPSPDIIAQEILICMHPAITSWERIIHWLHGC